MMLTGAITRLGMLWTVWLQNLSRSGVFLVKTNGRFLYPVATTGMLASLLSCQQGASVQPPVAKVIPVELEQHGHVRIDNYYWLRERENPEVIAYLEAENEYTRAMMAHTGGLQDKLFNEFKSRIKQTDTSVPYKKDDYYYYTRTETSMQYPIYCRKRLPPEAPEQVILDVNKIAEGHGFFSVRPPTISSGQHIMAYAVDTVGRRLYTIRFRDLNTGKDLKDAIPGVVGGTMAWANDDKTLFYSKRDPQTLRSHRIYRHVLGTDPAEDELVFEEKDETYRCFVFKTKSKQYIMIASLQALATEYRYLNADNPHGTFQLFVPRRRNHEYHVDHYETDFFVRTNDNAPNFRLAKTPVTRTAMKYWEEVIPHRRDVFLQGLEIFKDHLVVRERKDGLPEIRVISSSGADEHYLDFGEAAYVASLSDNHDFDTPILRYKYSSMTTPPSLYDYNMASSEKTLLKQEEVSGGFDSSNYRTERIHAIAKDGARIPISLVYRNGFERDGTNPLLLYGYGYYGLTMDAGFSPFIISLLDRGFVYAIAHVRGGQALGRQWHEDGKLLKKKNSFTDFIACAETLAGEKYVDPDRLFAMGGSAGGLLVAAVMNFRPALFKGVVAKVPWVDVLTTMLDDRIPSTPNDYNEVGNPNEKPYYDYILSYSPYDQVQAKDYPNLLVTTGLQDSQVQYWEPAKWVAKLRAVKTDDNLVLLKTGMEAGHGGATGRDKGYRETAFDYAFLLDIAGISE